MDNPHESYSAGRAAAGTLAIATNDEDVCNALYAESCVETAIKLLDSEKPELVHRALVIISNLTTVGGEKMTRALIEGGVLPHISVVTKFSDQNLHDLAMKCANEISDSMKSLH